MQNFYKVLLNSRNKKEAVYAADKSIENKLHSEGRLFHAHMKKVFPVLKRGESALVTKRKHIPTWLFKQSVDLTRQQQAIEKAVSEIGVLNAGKKRDEILEMVGPYFSRLEKHLGQMKKYQATIDYLTQENEGLKEKVNSEKSIQKQMEVLTLKKENERLRRFVESIPQEIRQAFQERQREQSAKAPQR